MTAFLRTRGHTYKAALAEWSKLLGIIPEDFFPVPRHNLRAVNLNLGYQTHARFDQWQEEGKHFVYCIKAITKKKLLKNNEIDPESNIFYDAIALLGTPGVNQTKKPVRIVGYTIDNTKYWIATSRLDLTAEQIALVYKLRWDIEIFFGWWKRHLRVYHLIAKSEYGLMVQILAGLITYLLLAIYCREQHN